MGDNLGIFGGYIHITENNMNNAGSIQDKLKGLEGLSGDALTLEMTKINFEIGQYNAMLELNSSLVKSMTDTLKSVCQKV